MHDHSINESIDCFCSNSLLLTCCCKKKQLGKKNSNIHPFWFWPSFRARKTVHKTRKEAETQMPSQFRLPEEDQEIGAQPDAERSHQPERMFTDRSGSQFVEVIVYPTRLCCYVRQYGDVIGLRKKNNNKMQIGPYLRNNWQQWRNCFVLNKN